MQNKFYNKTRALVLARKQPFTIARQVTVHWPLGPVSLLADPTGERELHSSLVGRFSSQLREEPKAKRADEMPSHASVHYLRSLPSVACPSIDSTTCSITILSGLTFPAPIAQHISSGLR